MFSIEHSAEAGGERPELAIQAFSAPPPPPPHTHSIAAPCAPVTAQTSHADTQGCCPCEPPLTNFASPCHRSRPTACRSCCSRARDSPLRASSDQFCIALSQVPPDRVPQLLFPCGHTFCATCITTHMERHRKTHCPVCRKKIDSKVRAHIWGLHFGAVVCGVGGSRWGYCALRGGPRTTVGFCLWARNPGACHGHGRCKMPQEGTALALCQTSAQAYTRSPHVGALPCLCRRPTTLCSSSFSTL